MTTKFDKAFFAAFRADLDAALAQVAVKHGITLKAGRIGYTETSFKVAVEATATSTDGTPTGKDAESFKALAEFYGLSPSDLGRTFQSRSGTHTIVGLNSRLQKNSIITETPDGKRYRWDEKVIANLLKVEASKAA
jgi:hypothetical protein